MRKQFPQLYKTPLPSNPLPDAWVVTPVKGEDTPLLGAKIRAANYPGVEQPAATGVTWWLQAYLPQDRDLARPCLEDAVSAGARAIVELLKPTLCK